MRYPERSLFFLSLSLVGLNVGLLLRAIFSREDIVCQWVVDADDRMQEVMTVEGHRNALCFVTFILVYFFAACSSSWMLSLSMAW